MKDRLILVLATLEVWYIRSVGIHALNMDDLQ